MKIKLVFAAMMFPLLTACGGAQKPEMTPLEIQSMQSRQFSASYNNVFASTMSVFQDLGYSVTGADKDTGLISAESATGSDVAYAIFTGSTLTSQTRATAFVERLKNKTNVRLNFVEARQTSSGWGQTNRRDQPIMDASIYQNAFERIENAIFIRR